MLYGDIPDFLQKKFDALNTQGINVRITRENKGRFTFVFVEIFKNGACGGGGFGLNVFDAFAMAYEGYILKQKEITT